MVCLMAETQQVDGVGCSLFILDRGFRPFFDDLCIDQIDDKYLGQLGDDGTRFQHRFPCLIGNAQVGAVPELRPRTGRDGNQVGAVLPGQTGGDQVKVLNLRILKKLPENNLLLVKGSIPGAKGSYLLIED